MKPKKHLIGLIFALLVFSGYSQVNNSIKTETGFIRHIGVLKRVDPLDGKYPYTIKEKQNGIDLNVIYGRKYDGVLFAGIGIGYLGFEKVNGFSLFSDFEIVPLKRTWFSPLLGLKLGYSHVWNNREDVLWESQNENMGTFLTEISVGLNFKATENLGIYLKTGLLLTQWSILTPIRIGIRF